MSENPALRGHPQIASADPPSLSRESKVESLAMSQDRHPSTMLRSPREPEKEERRGDPTMVPRPPKELEREERRGNPAMIPGLPREPEKKERRGDTAMTEEVGILRREIDKYKSKMLRLEKEGETLRREEQEWRAKCKRREDRIAKLKHEIAEMRGSWQETMEAQARRAQAMQEQLKQTEELLEARTAELSGAQTFLSTADRLSEMEVLSIVRDLNENIFQVAVSLTEEWEKLESSQATGRIELDLTSQPRVPVLVQLARSRDLTSLTFLLQSCLCYHAANMSSSWANNPELGVLKSVYKHLSASGKHHIINTK